MQPENLAYALVQVVHNFGAVAVLGGAACALGRAARPEALRRLAWLIFAGWSAQIVSGGLFGLTSLHYYGETPDLSRVAMTALVVKVAAAVLGWLLAAVYLMRRRQTWGSTRKTFRALAALAAVALTAAAFLRWFS